MVDINNWIDTFLEKLQETFGNRIEFAGLQGSYARGEATESSDIDVVVIFDDLSMEDIVEFNRMLDGLSDRELICRFVSGKQELLNWEPSDLFQFYFDTKPLLGTIDELMALIDEAAVERAIKIGACNIYHACVHNMLHEKSEEIVKALYKSAVFTIQAVCYRLTGEYVSSRSKLLDVSDELNREMLNVNAVLKNGGRVEFEQMSEKLFQWAKGIISGSRYEN